MVPCLIPKGISVSKVQSPVNSEPTETTETIETTETVEAKKAKETQVSSSNKLTVEEVQPVIENMEDDLQTEETDVESTNQPDVPIRLVPSQTSEAETIKEAVSCTQCFIFSTLSKEHVQMKTEYERLKVVYNDQSKEKQEILNEVNEMNNKLRVVEGEATKTRKEYEKKVKDMDMKVNEIQFRLVESYSVVDRKGQENVRLTEENRTLTKLLEFLHLEEVEAENEDAVGAIDEDETDPVDIIFIDNGDDPNDDLVIEAYLAQFSCDNEQNDAIPEEEEIAEILDLGDIEDPDDDDIIDFYLQQSVNRAKRTSPMSEATKTKNYSCKKCNFIANTKSSLNEHEKTKHKVKCTKCNFEAGTLLQLNLHNVAQHSTPNDENNKDKENQPSGRNAETPLRCDKCDFVAKSSEQLEKHIKVGHSQKVCWRNGFCENNNCRFQHPRSQERFEGRPPTMPCRYQQFCTRTDCPFMHDRNMIAQCRFGSFCENSACRLDHRNLAFLG